MIKCKINSIEAEIESLPTYLIDEQSVIDGTWRPGDGGWFPLKIVNGDVVPYQKDYVIELDQAVWNLYDVKRTGNELRFTSCCYNRIV